MPRCGLISFTCDDDAASDAVDVAAANDVADDVVANYF